MSDIGGAGSAWSQTDASNNTPAPQGFPEGMLPSGVNDAARALMGATKRFWDRINGTLATTNVANAYTLAYAVNDSSLYQGSIYTFRINAANTGAATLDVGDGTGAHAIVRNGPTATIPLASGDLVSGGYYSVAWDSISTQFVLLGGLPAAAAASVSADLYAALHSVSACLTSEIASLSAVVQADLDSTSAVIKADIASVSTVIKADIASVSSVIKADIASVSAVVYAQLHSVSACLTSEIASLSVATLANIASASAVIVAALHSVSACLTSEIASLSVHLDATLNNSTTTAVRLPLAWAAFRGSTTPPILLSSFNISSITRVTTGLFQINFSRRLQELVAIIGTGNQSICTIADAGSTGSTSFVSIALYEITNTIGSLTNDAYVSFVVYGTGYGT